MNKHYKGTLLSPPNTNLKAQKNLGNTYPTDLRARAWGGWLTRVICPHI